MNVATDTPFTALPDAPRRATARFMLGHPARWIGLALPANQRCRFRYAGSAASRQPSGLPSKSVSQRSAMLHAGSLADSGSASSLAHSSRNQ
mgnify:CR=1 FL=1